MRSFEAFVAQRYLKTRKKGAFVRIMVRFARWGIAVGVIALVITLALMNGFQQGIQETLFSATAHFTVSHFSRSIPDSEAALKVIRAIPGVAAASPSSMEQGLLNPTDSGAQPQALQVKAVDPATAHSTSSIFDSVQPGRVETLKPGEIILGKDLLESMGLAPGDDVAVAFLRLELGISGLQPRMMAFKIAGSFSSRISEYDRHWAFIHLEDAKRLAGADQAQSIEVRTTGVDRIDRVKEATLRALNANGPEAYYASDLRELNRPLFEALRLEKLLFGAILCLIILIAAFNIISSLVLFVTEKRRDLGVLLALGATPKQIQRLFELQGLRIGAVGTAWGLGFSIPLCWILDHFRLVKLPKAVYEYLTYLPFKLDPLDLVFVAVFPLLISWLASRYPAKRAASVDPVDALRAE